MRGWATLTLSLCAAGLSAQTAPDFRRDIEPLLARRCVPCHNASVSNNGLRLDDPEAMLAGGYSGPVIVPGRPDESKLLQRVTSTKKGFQMPPAGPPLSPAEIAVLRSWIEAGARVPARDKPPAASAPSAPASAAVSNTHWSFRPITRPEPPAVALRSWVRNPIDRFILARLEKEGIAPSPEAPRSVLLRRLWLDLAGLPPPPEEVRSFLADSRPDAYEHAVERLLASPHYAEQRARAWLDVARYGDSDGLEKDLVRPYAWRWRQWVIEAFHRDMPFDQFTIEQLAGDLLPGATIEQRVATGFHRNTLTNREGGTDPAESRFEQLVNRVNTTATAWLGLTAGCAQCHDHKYDPLKQKEYYQLLAFFNRSEEVNIDAPMPGEFGEWMRKRPEYLAKREALIREFDVESLQEEWEEKLRHAMDNPGKDPDWDFAVANTRPMLDRFEYLIRKGKQRRTERENEAVFYQFINNPGPLTPGRDVDKILCLREFRRRLAALDREYPRLTQAMTMMELEEPPQTYIALKGDFRARGLPVEPDVPAFLPPLPKDAPRNRLTLARWLVSNENPLTARVVVNRIWQEFFGRGLVRTSEDFGTQGEPPSHPELLDWLASEFRNQGWSVKHIVRLIVTSATYRQSSHVRRDLIEKDPDNTLLARQSRLRLPAENIRDAALAAAGLLNTQVGGPSVRPPQPAGVAELGYAGSVKWVEDDGPARYRRGMYILFQRTAPYPMLMNFDMPDSFTSCARRRRSNSPLQALNLLNDPVFYEAAQALALRVVREAPPEARIDHAFLLALGRLPAGRERERVERFLREEQKRFDAAPELARQVLPLDPAHAAWVGAARALLNLEEFITRE
ncbi:MAG: PSD1 and planctomycete cytochrome C domain-containing protein [Bryobacteraceae bacterium]|nr:PSD1 and planctomycete cytochrome C domain-containing protein [Bryobacteraceae bacterium]